MDAPNRVRKSAAIAVLWATVALIVGGGAARPNCHDRAALSVGAVGVVSAAALTFAILRARG